MKNAIDENLEEIVCVWLCNELSFHGETSITPSTRINIDLGVAGDDGFDLIEKFKKEFGCDDLPLPLIKYFGSEASANPITVINSLVRVFFGRPGCALKPLYVSDLISLAKEGRGQKKAEEQKGRGQGRNPE